MILLFDQQNLIKALTALRGSIVSESSRKHAYIMLTPLNPTFI